MEKYDSRGNLKQRRYKGDISRTTISMRSDVFADILRLCDEEDRPFSNQLVHMYHYYIKDRGID